MSKSATKNEIVEWVASLHRELSEIYLEQRFRGRRPSIRLGHRESHWGSFDPLDFEITISQMLIEECPWWVVVEVLKHEIAHLFVHSAFPDEDKPHGRRFNDVCESLNVADWARGATIGKTLAEMRTLFDWRTARLDERTEKYRGRLAKLLALANSGNENEALVAMRRARELQDKHRLEDLELGRPTRFVNLEINSGKQRHAAITQRSVVTKPLSTSWEAEKMYYSRSTYTAFFTRVLNRCGKRIASKAMPKVYGRATALFAASLWAFTKSSMTRIRRLPGQSNSISSSKRLLLPTDESERLLRREDILVSFSAVAAPESIAAPSPMARVKADV